MSWHCVDAVPRSTFCCVHEVHVEPPREVDTMSNEIRQSTIAVVAMQFPPAMVLCASEEVRWRP